MDPSNLKYTIIIPCYNSEKWLSTSIESALNQTYKNVEVIVIDNESSDRSLEIAKKYSDQATIGTAKNIYKHSYQEPVEEALKLATGDYFTILGSDDFIEPTYIENLNKIISTDPSRINFLQSPLIGVQSDTGKSVGEIKHEYRSLAEFKKSQVSQVSLSNVQTRGADCPSPHCTLLHWHCNVALFEETFNVNCFLT